MTPRDPGPVPPGSTTNPSAWRHRVPVAVAAAVGLGLASYLALYQLGAIVQVWDPLFGDGSRRVLHSALSRLLPVPDAVLGGVAYAADVVLDLAGGTHRWRDRPWVAIAFALAAMGFAIVSAGLVVYQAVGVHAFCTLCLASAALSIALVVPATAEGRASLRYLARERRHGGSAWQALRGPRAGAARP